MVVVSIGTDTDAGTTFDVSKRLSGFTLKRRCSRMLSSGTEHASDDEKWGHHFELESKRQSSHWKRATSPPPKKIKGCAQQFCSGLQTVEPWGSTKPRCFMSHNKNMKKKLTTTRGLLATDHVILNHGQVRWTTPELVPRLLTATPHQREDVSALDRFNVPRCPTRRVFSGTELELVTWQAMVRYPYHSATAATMRNRKIPDFYTAPKHYTRCRIRMEMLKAAVKQFLSMVSLGSNLITVVLQKNLEDPELSKNGHQNDANLVPSPSSHSIASMSRSSIRYLKNWPKTMDSIALNIISKLPRHHQRKLFCLQWIPSHVGVPGNETVDELSGRDCDFSDPSSSALKHSEIISLHRVKMNLT
ncbi:uncharacterized protein TNCV_4210801 [Trichonephila clavipes]|nr:uncharacterized protein TNCV_4210801 [Trichonephila clavipes]